jgi:hypothetical protein
LVVVLILPFVVGAPLLGIVLISIFVVDAPLLGIAVSVSICVSNLIFVAPLLGISPIFAIVASDRVPDEATYDGAPDHAAGTTAAHRGAKCTTSDSAHARIDCGVVPAIGSHRGCG